MNQSTAFAWIALALSAAFSILVVLGTLFMLIACAPNTSARQQDVLKVCAIAVTIASALGLACGAWSAIACRPWIAAASFAVPGLVSLLALVALWISER